MKKFYIGNFRNIFEEIEIDMEEENSLVFIGPNGIGKTNILEAIDWFVEEINHKDKIYENVTTKSIDNTLNILGENDRTYVTFVSDINNDMIKDINNVIDSNKECSIKFKLSNDHLMDYKIIIERSSKSSSGLYYNKNFKDKNNIENKNILRYCIDKIISEFVENHNKAGISLNDFFNKDTDGLYVTLNNKIDDYENYISNVKAVELYNNKVRENENINVELKTKPKKPYEEIKYTELMRVKKLIGDVELIFNINNLIAIDYVVNASNENNTAYKYSIGRLKNSNISYFLNGFFNFSGYLDELEIADKSGTDDNSMGTIKTIVDKLSKDTQEAISKLFDKFDISMKPDFDYINNQLLISVKNKHDFNIGVTKTELNSSGYKAFFEIMLRIKSILQKAEHNNKKYLLYLLLADEPEKNLHIKLQIQLRKFILDNIKEIPNIYFLYATHSPYFIDPYNSLVFTCSAIDAGKSSGSLVVDPIPKENFSDNNYLISKKILTLLEACGVINNYSKNEILSIDDACRNSAYYQEKLILIDEEIANKQNSDYDHKKTYMDIIKENIDKYCDEYHIRTFKKKDDILKVYKKEEYIIIEIEEFIKHISFINSIKKSKENFLPIVIFNK
ncbi:AAA family ATPase [Spiroplasma endosymbiont of Aspidapion aeneum]|uniref:AAA family ATPase n=1 Tax=Spiroplasma endosymbiont of Aspidapion aeneum TaxID=3066276 RepID=UPI00313EA062